MYDKSHVTFNIVNNLLQIDIILNMFSFVLDNYSIIDCSATSESSVSLPAQLQSVIVMRLSVKSKTHRSLTLKSIPQLSTSVPVTCVRVYVPRTHPSWSPSKVRRRRTDCLTCFLETQRWSWVISMTSSTRKRDATVSESERPNTYDDTQEAGQRDSLENFPGHANRSPLGQIPWLELVRDHKGTPFMTQWKKDRLDRRTEQDLVTSWLVRVELRACEELTDSVVKIVEMEEGARDVKVFSGSGKWESQRLVGHTQTRTSLRSEDVPEKQLFRTSRMERQFHVVIAPGCPADGVTRRWNPWSCLRDQWSKGSYLSSSAK